ncbi:MAG: TIGR02757 family protein [Muribaculaceae bacterium]|nr:TIGR02757 family protein [Muribaculaceae bacterium]
MKDLLKQKLDRAVETINRPDFIGADPVQFPRRFSDKRDIEIVSLLTSHIAWGNRKMICNNCEKLLKMLDNQPYHFLMEGDIESFDPDRNIHRTFFGRDLKYFLRGLRSIYAQHGSLEEFALSGGSADSEAPAWHLASLINCQLQQANQGKEKSVRCLPENLGQTPLKRLNMALRWLVRDDGIVDMGVWQGIKPSQLFIPLDVHVADTSRTLGLLERRSNDRKAVVELTDCLRRFDPTDPVKYDFALFGLGINNGSVEGEGVD